MQFYTEKAYAKINLAIDVLYKRPDGYHEVKMIMTSVNLFDELTFQVREDKHIKITSDCPTLPNNKNNLIYKAADLLTKMYNIDYGVNITLNKKIPISAGLGGGSSDAAATLRGLNVLWNLNLSPLQLVTIGAHIGSDVPFCVTGETALATGRGEKLTKLPKPPNCFIVIAQPNIYVSTKEVYDSLDLTSITHPNIDNIIFALKNQNYKETCKNMGNVLETVTINKYPKLQKIKNILLNYGADTALMSGSGSAMFGMFTNDRNLNKLKNSLNDISVKSFILSVI